MYEVYTPLHAVHVVLHADNRTRTVIENHQKKKHQPKVCLSRPTPLTDSCHTTKQAFTLTNAGRLAWFGLFTIKNLKFLNSTRAGAPGWELTNLLWLLAVIFALRPSVYTRDFVQSEERAGDIDGWGVMYWRIWIQGEGSHRGRWELHVVMYNIFCRGTRTVVVQFDYISVHSIVQFYPQLQYYTILWLSVTSSVDVVGCGGWLAGWMNGWESLKKKKR